MINRPRNKITSLNSTVNELKYRDVLSGSTCSSTFCHIMQYNIGDGAAYHRTWMHPRRTAAAEFPSNYWRYIMDGEHTRT